MPRVIDEKNYQTGKPNTWRKRAAGYEKLANDYRKNIVPPQPKEAERWENRALKLRGAAMLQTHKPRDTHAIAKKAAATRKAHGGLVGNLAKASAHAKR